MKTQPRGPFLSRSSRTEARPAVLCIPWLLVGLLVLSGCGTHRPPPNRQAENSKVRIITRQEARENTPIEQAISRWAKKFAQQTTSRQGRPALLVKGFVNTDKPEEKWPIASEMDALLLKYLVRYAPEGGYQVLEAQPSYSSQTEGSPIHDPDLVISPQYSWSQGHYHVTFRVSQVQSSEQIIVDSIYIPKQPGSALGDYYLSENRVFDTATSLSWERRANPNVYRFETAQLYCQGLIIDGYRDWRVPNDQEIYSIIGRPTPPVDSMLPQALTQLFTQGSTSKEQIFGFNYRQLAPQSRCHWFEQKASAKAANLNSGKAVLQPAACQIKCVRGTDPAAGTP
ncbi:MAG: DUF1566 domain-containing protein [bacterium]|nr:DUF1566 domain-containing protein [bacterium]